MTVFKWLKMWLVAAAICASTAVAASAADENAAAAPGAGAESAASADKAQTSEPDSEKSDKRAGKTPDKPSGPPRIVAWVNGTPIYLADVQRLMAATMAGRKLDNDTAAYLQATILQQLITQSVVLKYLEKEHLLVSAAETDAALNDFKEKLQQKKLTWKEYLEATKQTEAAARRQKSWDMALDKYVARNMTDENLEEYFKHNKEKFDGTERRISHILLRPLGTSDAGARDLAAQAEQLRGRIRTGELTFEAAVAKYSDGPSRRSGGDLGFFPRQGVLADQFSEVAFALRPSVDVSPPVITPFGVHLIKVTDERPGHKTWQESREAVKAAYSRYAIEKMIADQNAAAKVEYAENFPHFAPGTHDLVLPTTPVGTR